MNHRNISVLVVLSVLVFAGLMIYGDASEVIGSIADFPLHYWLMALGLAAVNYLLRMVRWNYYLKVLGIRADIKTSSLIFLSGLSMAISPGRVGELAKSYFLKEKAGTPVAVSAPAVISERILDLISVLLLGVWGLVFIPYGWVVILVVLATLGVFLALLATPGGVTLLTRLPLFRKWTPIISTSGDAFRKILSPKAIAVGLMLGGLAWLAEGLALWIVIQGLGSSVQVPLAISIYCAASLLGALTMLPGGLVGTEGSMLGLLQGVGLTSAIASSSTLIIRVCTLWFAVAIGVAALLYMQFRAKGRGSLDSEKLKAASGELAGGDGD